MFQISYKRISTKYKKTLIDLFPKEFQNIEQLDKYEKDIAKHTDRFNEKTTIQILYHPKDIKEIKFPLSTKQPITSFVKRARPRNEKYFFNKPQICLPKDAKQVMKIKILTRGYELKLFKNTIMPFSVNKINLSLKEKSFFENKEKGEYFDFYTPILTKMKYGYLDFQNKESQEYFIKQYLQNNF